MFVCSVIPGIFQTQFHFVRVFYVSVDVCEDTCFYIRFNILQENLGHSAVHEVENSRSSSSSRKVVPKDKSMGVNKIGRTELQMVFDVRNSKYLHSGSRNTNTSNSSGYT